MARSGYKNEFAVIGLGRFGSSLATELAAQGYDVMGIDLDPALVQEFAEDLTFTAALDASDEDALRSIDIQSFDTVVVAIGANFEANLMATLALKSMGVRRVVCKALSRRQAEVLARVGADMVVLPEEDAGRRLAFQLGTSNLGGLLPLEPGYSIAEVPLQDRFAGQTLAQANLKRRFGLTVLVVHRDHDALVTPEETFRLQSGDMLVMIGPDEGFTRFSHDA